MRCTHAGGRLLVLAALFGAAALPIERPAGAQEAPPPPAFAAMMGRYVNRDADGGLAMIEARTEAVVADLRPAIRGIGRRHILRNNPPIRELRIGYEGGEAIVEYVGQHRRYHAPVGGPAVENTAPAGGSVDVSYRLRDDLLVEDMRTRRGRAVAKYRLCPPEGELHLETRVISGSLPRDIVYEHVFRGPTRAGRPSS